MLQPMLLVLVAAASAAAAGSLPTGTTSLETGVVEERQLLRYATAYCGCSGSGASRVCDAYVRYDFVTNASCVAGGAGTPDALVSDAQAVPIEHVPAACVPSHVTGAFYSTSPDACAVGAAVLNLTLYWDAACALVRQSVSVPAAQPCAAVNVTVTPLPPPEEDDSADPFSTRRIIIIALTPFVTAIIGYGTNVIAIKMIFRPYTPKCGFAFHICGPSSTNPGEPRCYWKGIQGVFPKRQYALALQIGEMVNKNLISAEEMVTKMKKELGLNDENPEAPSKMDEDLAEGIKGAVTGMIDKKASTPGFGMFLKSMGGKEAFCDNLTRGTVVSFKSNLPFLMETFGMRTRVTLSFPLPRATHAHTHTHRPQLLPSPHTFRSVTLSQTGSGTR